MIRSDRKGLLQPKKSTATISRAGKCWNGQCKRALTQLQPNVVANPAGCVALVGASRPMGSTFSPLRILEDIEEQESVCA